MKKQNSPYETAFSSSSRGFGVSGETWFFFGNIILFFETAAGVPRITSPLSKLAFCATSHPALLSRPAACRARALDIRAFRRSYYSKWPL